MAEEEIKKIRLQKLKNIKEKGIDPYPAHFEKPQRIIEAISFFEEGKEITLAGRIMSIREHGGLIFFHFFDGSGKFQGCLRRDILGKENYQFFIENFDIGDFILTQGKLFLTKKGEKTIDVQNYQILAKTLLPLPEKWYGLEEIEERYRKRYLDLLVNEEIRKKFFLRSRIIFEIRKFFEKEGFIEVETPVFQKRAGGAAAKPFKTHLDALDMDLYLRIAPELYLKMLLIGGFEKVFEIGKAFRNEGIDRAHNPEFTLLEFYWAWSDENLLMKLCEKLLKKLVVTIFGKEEFEYQGKKISFQSSFERVEFQEILCEEIGADPFKLNSEEIKKIAKKFGMPYEGKIPSKILDDIFKKRCLSKIKSPTFVLHQPIDLTPLAKSHEKNKKLAARFQLIIGGWEIANGFAELNDPLEQKRRFETEEIQRKKGNLETHPFDRDFIEALSYGMPPAAGCGVGIDRLCALFTNSKSIREIILFPLMK